MNATNLKRRIVLIGLLVLYLFFDKGFFMSQAAVLKNNFRILSLSIEKKYELIDGQFYHFMEFSKEKIPQQNTVLLINASKDLKEHTSEWVRSEYIKQKTAYYLYPRKVISRNLETLNKKDYFKVIYEMTPSGVSFKLSNPGEEK